MNVEVGAVEVRMPRLSDSMEAGTVLRWLKSNGDHVSRGDALAEIETDKATMTYEAEADGVLGIVVDEGDTVPVGGTIARLLSAAQQPVDTGGRVKASPIARRVARHLGVDLATVVGTGPNGRVVRADVEAAHVQADAPEPAGTSATDAKPAETRVGQPVAASGGASASLELTRAQALIARRMAQAKATVPDFAVTIEVDTEALFAIREQLRGEIDPVPSINDFVIAASARALREHPRVNGSYRDTHVELHERINVGMAVATEHSLVVPTIFDADALRLSALARETRRLAEEARAETISPAALAGGTFTVSNLGMFGVTRFVAVVNHPQAAILAVGAAGPRAVPTHDGGFKASRILALTLSADHRIVYGAHAAGFLGLVRDLLERPLALLA